MHRLLTATLGGAMPPALPPGCCIRVHRIATEAEAQEDTVEPVPCSRCRVIKEQEEFYTRPNGDKFKVCKTCMNKDKAKRDAARRAAK